MNSGFVLKRMKAPHYFMRHRTCEAKTCWTERKEDASVFETTQGAKNVRNFLVDVNKIDISIVKSRIVEANAA
jgi:hypothetical protein